MKEDVKYLQHIAECIRNVEEFVVEVHKKAFCENIEKQYAVVRGIEIIGEAVKNLSTTLKKDHPAIVWRDIAGTRDILIHSYFSVDLDLVWNIVQKDLPLLKEAVVVLLKEEKQ